MIWFFPSEASRDDTATSALLRAVLDEVYESISHGGWKITAKGRAALEFLEARHGTDQTLDAPLTETVAAPVPALRQPAERAKRRRERRERRREAHERARANAS